MTLLYFAQSLFLVFASVYIAKESIETVLLGEGAHSHGGGGGHGHGAEREHGHDHEGEAEERYVQQLRADCELTTRALPLLLLAAAIGTSLFSGIALLNHSKLVECEYLSLMPGRRLTIQLSVLCLCPLLLSNHVYRNNSQSCAIPLQ
jgi:hypothetical protein